MWLGEWYMTELDTVVLVLCVAQGLLISLLSDMFGFEYEYVGTATSFFAKVSCGVFATFPSAYLITVQDIEWLYII
jgi:hypothetical protein